MWKIQGPRPAEARPQVDRSRPQGLQEPVGMWPTTTVLCNSSPCPSRKGQSWPPWNLDLYCWVNEHSDWKAPFVIGKPSISGTFCIATRLNYQKVGYELRVDQHSYFDDGLKTEKTSLCDSFETQMALSENGIPLKSDSLSSDFPWTLPCWCIHTMFGPTQIW